MNLIEEYIISKNGTINGSALDSLIHLMNKENGISKAPGMLHGVTNLEIQHVDLSDIHYHELRLEQVEPREIPVGGLAGVLLARSRGYWLIDGYHRLKSLRAANALTAPYIVLFN